MCPSPSLTVRIARCAEAASIHEKGNAAVVRVLGRRCASVPAGDQAAKQSIGKPLKTPRIDIDIVFACKDRNLRADVDNVAKPVLDALKDVLYDDDRQVRSVRVVALPLDDVFKASGPVTAETWKRLLECEEFLVVARVNSELHLEFF
jgi:hypothetical protein